MRLVQRWKQTSLPNKALVSTSVLVAFGTLFYAGAAAWQVCIMRTSAQQSSEQTAKLIQQAEKNAKAAEDFAKAAQSQSDEMAQLVSKSGNQATSTNALAVQARRSADTSDLALKLQTRPWMGIERINVDGNVEAGGTLKVSIVFKNWGLSPSLHTASEAQLTGSCDELPKHPIYKIVTPPTPAAVMPNQLFQTETFEAARPLNEQDLGALKVNSKCNLYIHARVTYSDLRNTKHWRHICGQWDKKTKQGFNTCPVYNDGDEDYEDGKEP